MTKKYLLFFAILLTTLQTFIPIDFYIPGTIAVYLCVLYFCNEGLRSSASPFKFILVPTVLLFFIGKVWTVLGSIIFLPLNMLQVFALLILGVKTKTIVINQKKSFYVTLVLAFIVSIFLARVDQLQVEALWSHISQYGEAPPSTGLPIVKMLSHLVAFFPPVFFIHSVNKKPEEQSQKLVA